MIDLKDYQAKKAKELASVISTDGAGDDSRTYVVSYVKYDPAKAAEGELVRIPNEVASVSKKELTDRISVLQAEIDDIEAFMAEGDEAEPA